MKFSNLSVIAFSVALTVQPLMAQEMKPKPAGDATPMMAMDKPTFVKIVTSANEFEIRSSDLAKQNADQTGIKMAAEMIIADHRKAGDRLKATLEAKGGAPVEPVKLAPKHQKMLDQLQMAKERISTCSISTCRRRPTWRRSVCSGPTPVQATTNPWSALPRKLCRASKPILPM